MVQATIFPGSDFLKFTIFLIKNRFAVLRSITLLFLISLACSLAAQPSPGDLFREYTWFNVSGDCNGALRVGGTLDYRLTNNADHLREEGQILPGFNVDLTGAVRAELVIEKMLCHQDTRGLRVSINGHDPIRLPEPEHIPVAQSAYAHHFNALVPVELTQLDQGPGNSFSFEVDTAGHWWPQNLVYGMILRIYYRSGSVEERGNIILPRDGDILDTLNQIIYEAPPGEKVEKIDLVGFYKDADLEGDGLYQQWHYSYHKCEIYNHIGTISGSPNEFIWNTEWLPDQDEKIRLAAFIHRSDGFIYMTDPVNNLVLDRPGISVELCKPYRRPRGWYTRNGTFEERFQIKGDLNRAIEAKLVFRSWSPGYFNGIYINNFIVFMREGPRYDYYLHHIPVEALYALQQGENILMTGKTPLYSGIMVHGVEIQWPGIMLLVKYKTTN